MSLQLLQENVALLSREELKAFFQWFEKFMSDQWDKEIEQDVAAGRFDEIAKRALEHHRLGLTTPL